MDKDHTSKKILKLTLEIIYLLTGEDYMVINRESGERVTPRRSRTQVSGGWGIMVPPPHNELKILGLTNKIIHLLTGEACNYIDYDDDDDLCEDLISENHQPCMPLDRSETFQGLDKHQWGLGHQLAAAASAADQSNARNVARRLHSPSPLKGCLNEEQSSNGTSQGTKFSMMCNEEKIGYNKQLTEESNGKGDLPDTDTTIEQTKYHSAFSMEDSVSHAEGTLTELGVSTQTGNSDIEYMLVHVKEESEEDTKTECTKTERTQIKRKTPYGGGPGVKNRGTKSSNKYLSVNCTQGVQNQQRMSAVLHQIAPGIKTYKCSECEESFTCNSDLLKHQTHHKGSKLFKCSVCGKNFTSKSNLAKHHKIHTGEKPYSCSECGKRFREKHYLISHQSVHKGPQLIACPQCGKGYTSKSNLTKHQRIHTGDKPFACAECGKSFNQRSVLITHHRTHTGEKPFCCQVCGKRFTDNLQLVRHSLTHSGEKPFSCSECGKSFSQKNLLLKHLNLHK